MQEMQVIRAALVSVEGPACTKDTMAAKAITDYNSGAG